MTSNVRATPSNLTTATQPSVLAASIRTGSDLHVIYDSATILRRVSSSTLRRFSASQLPKRPAAEMLEASKMSLFPQPRAALLFRLLLYPLHVTNNRRVLHAVDFRVVDIAGSLTY
jgi:hypothetical protein